MLSYEGYRFLFVRLLITGTAYVLPLMQTGHASFTSFSTFKCPSAPVVQGIRFEFFSHGTAFRVAGNGFEPQRGQCCCGSSLNHFAVQDGQAAYHWRLSLIAIAIPTGVLKDPCMSEVCGFADDRKIIPTKAS